MIKQLVCSVILITACLGGFAQQQSAVKYPRVGDTLESHKFYDVVNYSGGRTLSTDNFRGKWLVLDFWAYSCSSCLASFPHMEEMKKKFDGRVQFIMVAPNKYDLDDGPEQVRLMDSLNRVAYKRLDAKNHFTFATAYDTIVPFKYDVGSLPYILVVNPQGQIVLKTSRLSEGQLNSLIAGVTPIHQRAFSRHEPSPSASYNRNLPLLTNGFDANGGIDTSYTYRVMLVPGNPVVPYRTIPDGFFVEGGSIKAVLDNGKAEIFNQNFYSLYKLAYLGCSEWYAANMSEILSYRNNSNKIKLYTKDSTEFDRLALNLYSVDIRVPRNRATPKYYMHILQELLQNNFPYKASVEPIETEALVMSVFDHDRFKKTIAEGNEPFSRFASYEGYRVSNYQIIDLCGVIRNFTQKDKRTSDMLECFTHEGLDANTKINIDFKANMTDLNSINQALAKFGLVVKKGLKKLETLVIRDAEQ